jgi:hypothetical protein
MIDSTTWRGARRRKLLWLGGVSLLLLTTGCKSTNAAIKNPSMQVQDDRNAAGVLQSLTVNGSGFTPNGQAHITALMAVSGSTASPYVEADIQADANGKFRFERRPMSCPQPVDYGPGSWVSISARDTTSGISATKALTPGRQPDCGG